MQAFLLLVLLPALGSSPERTLTALFSGVASVQVLCRAVGKTRILPTSAVPSSCWRRMTYVTYFFSNYEGLGVVDPFNHRVTSVNLILETGSMSLTSPGVACGHILVLGRQREWFRTRGSGHVKDAVREVARN